MTYEDFCEELLADLKEKAGKLSYDTVRFYPDGFTSDDPGELKTIQSTNIKYHKMESDTLIGDFIILMMDNKHHQSCRFSCSELYDRHKQYGGFDAVWEVINANLEACEENISLGIMDLIDKHDYELIKEKIIIRPLNFNDHRYELKENVYKRIGDIVLVLYILASDTSEGEMHNVMSMKLPKSLIDSWGMDVDEVWDNALTNTYVLSPPRLYKNPMDLYKPPYHKGTFMAVNNDITSLSAIDIPTLTTTTQMNGAIAIFYPKVMERIAELFGDDYYVAFTSIHELKLHKKDTIPPRQILGNVKATNKHFDPTEILSRKVYIYERAAGELRQLEL